MVHRLQHTSAWVWLDSHVVAKVPSLMSDMLVLNLVSSRPRDNGARFGPWYGFDDSHTDGPLAPGEAQTRAAYLLFYRRRQDAAQDPCAPSTLHCRVTWTAHAAD